MNLLGRVVRLYVTNEGFEVWRWRMSLDSAVLVVGVAQTKIAAQVASQIAVEQWLKHKGKSEQQPYRYIWVENIG